MPIRPASLPSRWRTLLAATALLCACSSAGSDDDAADDAADTADDGGEVTTPRTAVGEVEGTDIFVGTVVEEGRVVVYFCGGDDTYATHTHWFSGVPDGSEFAMELEGWSVDGTADATGVAGRLTEPDGTEHAFRTDEADSEVAGLFSTMEGACRAGVIVHDEQTAQGTFFCSDGTPSEQVIILQPIELVDGGIDVTVELEDGPTSLVVEPV